MTLKYKKKIDNCKNNAEYKRNNNFVEKLKVLVKLKSSSYLLRLYRTVGINQKK